MAHLDDCCNFRFNFCFQELSLKTTQNRACFLHPSPRPRHPTVVSKPILSAKHTRAGSFTPGHPKRFAQSIGFVLAAVCTVLAFLELRVVMGIVALCLFGASALAAFFDVCLGCIIFM